MIRIVLTKKAIHTDYFLLKFRPNEHITQFIKKINVIKEHVTFPVTSC